MQPFSSLCLQLAMCAPNPDSCGGTGGCQGSTTELAFEYVSGSKGLSQEFQYPYTSYYGKNAGGSSVSISFCQNFYP